MSRTLAIAREEFIAAMNRDTDPTEQPRMVAVLDALIAWSRKHPEEIRFRESEKHAGVVSFERIGSNLVFWSAHPRRREVPKLELLPRAASVLTAEDRANAMSAINANSREGLLEDDKLRIGFGALKNVTQRNAVLAMMEQLLIATGQVTT